MLAKAQATTSTLDSAYRDAGVDTSEADNGLKKLVRRVVKTWPPEHQFGSVQLGIGYFANVVDFGGTGLAICMDGVGSKAIVAGDMNCYDTIGIDCVAMNVNNLICVEARPVSFVDYIGVEEIDEFMIDQISIGLVEGAQQSNMSIPGGEISQLKDIFTGFDLIGTAFGTVPLDRIITGKNLFPDDVVIGLESNGIHSNGLSLARRAFGDGGKVNYDRRFDELEGTLGQELLRPTYMYVQEVLEIMDTIPETKALINITSDGLMNLARVDADVSFMIDDLPPPPPIFELIQKQASVDIAEMYQVFNMGVGFCVIVSEEAADATLAILRPHGRRAQLIGYVTENSTKCVVLAQHGLVGNGKYFRKA